MFFDTDKNNYALDGNRSGDRVLAKLNKEQQRNRIVNSPSNSQCGSDDENGVLNVSLNDEELSNKINTFRNLCLRNKITTKNAFDIDMIGQFSNWLEKTKRCNKSAGGESFTKIADYLDASGTVYSLRVDGLSENTTKFLEKFRSTNLPNDLKKNDDNGDNNDEEVESVKTNKPKKTRSMLVAPEKLRGKSTESEKLNDPCLKQGVYTFDFFELFKTTRPANFVKSIFTNKSFKDEFEEMDHKIKPNNKDCFYEMADLENEMANKVICSDYHKFVTRRDTDDKGEKDQEHLLKGIEDRFDPNNHKFQNINDNSFPNEIDIAEDNGPSSNENDEPIIDELIECIDNVDRDFSFFNPQLLAKWRGPKKWKDQAMVKALKSRNTKKKMDNMNNADTDDIDNTSQDEEKLPKTIKKRNKVQDNKVKIKWCKMNKIKEYLDNTIQEKKNMMSSMTNKWDPLENIADPKSADFEKLLTYKFSYLNYMSVHSNLLKHTNKQNFNEEIFKESPPSPTSQSDEECNEQISETKVIFDHDFHEPEKDNESENDNELEFNNPENSNFLQWIKSNEEEFNEEEHISGGKKETNVDVGKLKKEIFNIINQECVPIEDNNEWSSQLSYGNLLLKLKIVERELTPAIVYVCLLILTNEKNLKLSQEYTNNIDEIQEVFISKPIKD